MSDIRFMPAPAPTDLRSPSFQTTDRRRHPRREVERPGKVYHLPSRRFVPARTVNVSDGGALLLVSSGRSMGEGEGLDVAILWGPGGLIPDRTMLRGRVVRSVPAGPEAQMVAVRFEPVAANTVAA